MMSKREKEMMCWLSRFWHKFGLKYLSCVCGLVTIAGCLRLSPPSREKEDSLFEDWVRHQLSGIESWQASTAQGDPRNKELIQCLWQRRAGEKDCQASESFHHPFSFRLRNGYLLSSGIKFPRSGYINPRLFERMIKNISGGFGFHADWRPCVGELCRFEVFTGFVPVCENDAEMCGRADRLLISYVILSRREKQFFWQPYLKVISNLNQENDIRRVEFKTENVFGLPPLLCRDSSLVALTQGDSRQLTCGFSTEGIRSACRSYEHNSDELLKSGYCTPETCQVKCNEVDELLAEKCESPDLQPNSRSPDLYRCKDNAKLWYLRDPIDLHDDARSTGRTHLLFRVFGIEPDFCLFRNVCFGRFSATPLARTVTPFLESR